MGFPARCVHRLHAGAARRSSKATRNGPMVMAESARLNAGQTELAGVQLQKIGDAAVQQAIEQIARRASGNQSEARLASGRRRRVQRQAASRAKSQSTAELMIRRIEIHLRCRLGQ